MKSILALVVVIGLVSLTVQGAKSPECELDLSPGPCLAYFPRYGFDKTAKKCVKFVYGGCQRNDNNFQTEDECKQKCE